MPSASASSVIGVLVVDDQYIVRRGIISTLADIPGVNCLGEADSGEQAIVLARRLRPEIVLMDLRMPGIGGLEAARRIGIALPATRTIAVTVCESEPPGRLGRSRIAACVGKDVRAPELEATIRRVLSPRRVATPPASPGARPANPFDQLSGREMQVCMRLLAGRRPCQIALELSNSVKTVYTLRYRILDKLGVGCDIELAKLAASHGLIAV